MTYLWLREENMKEYKTLQVSPEKECETITECGAFDWKLEDTREVYNETQEILGVDEKVTAYGSFMRGFIDSRDSCGSLSFD